MRCPKHGKTCTDPDCMEEAAVNRGNIIFIIALFLLALFLSKLGYAAEPRVTYQLTVELKWTDAVTGEQGFIVYRNKQPIAKTAANQTVYRDIVTGAVGEKFCYTVSAFNTEFVDGSGAVQETPVSNESCQEIKVPTQPPPSGAPTGLTTTPISTTAIQASWNDNSDNEVKFTVVRKQFKPARTLMFDVVANENAVLDEDLKRNRTYCYTVLAVFPDGSFLSSNESCSTTRA